jgi:hypothetical protein
VHDVVFVLFWVVIVEVSGHWQLVEAVSEEIVH